MPFLCKGLPCALQTFQATARLRLLRPASQSKILHHLPRSMSTSLQRCNIPPPAFNPKEDLSEIDNSLADRPWIALKGNTHWGFVVYRCTYKDNPRWQRMLEALNSKVIQGLETYERMDLLVCHRLTVMDDADKYNGATSHDIRDHFHSWVAGELPTLLKDPSMWENTVLGTDEEGAVQMRLGARYNFCLFVDDICLESLDKMDIPVVKLLCRFRGYREPDDRDYQVHPWFEDGETEFDEEDVGWMYMSVVEYCSYYRDLVDTNNWYSAYLRPPCMMFMDDSELPGHWRAKP